MTSAPPSLPGCSLPAALRSREPPHRRWGLLPSLPFSLPTFLPFFFEERNDRSGHTDDLVHLPFLRGLENAMRWAMLVSVQPGRLCERGWPGQLPVAARGEGCGFSCAHGTQTALAPGLPTLKPGLPGFGGTRKVTTMWEAALAQRCTHTALPHISFFISGSVCKVLLMGD